MPNEELRARQVRLAMKHLQDAANALNGAASDCSTTGQRHDHESAASVVRNFSELLRSLNRTAPAPYVVRIPGRSEFRVNREELRDHLIRHEVSYSEVWEHVADVDAGCVLHADDGTEFRLAGV